MHYFKKNIGDYYKRAGRFTMLQHGACTLIVDACYDRERFPTLDDAIEWSWASSKEEIDAVEFVLRKLFTLEDDVYVNEFIQADLDKFKANGETNRRIALEREEKRRKQREAKEKEKETDRDVNSTNRDEDSTNRAPTVHEPSTVEHEAPPNQEPLTTNQEPIDLKTMPTKVVNPVFELFSFWKDVMKKTGSTKLSAKRKKAIENRLKDGYTVEEFKRAIFNCSNTAHNMGYDRYGNHTGKKYDDIELICRNSENFERFRDNIGDMNGATGDANNSGHSKPGRKLSVEDEIKQRMLDKYGDSATRNQWEHGQPSDHGMGEPGISRGIQAEMGQTGFTIDMES